MKGFLHENGFKKQWGASKRVDSSGQQIRPNFVREVDLDPL